MNTPSRTKSIYSQSLAHCQNISLAVLEPCRLCSSPSRNAVLHLDPWNVIFLEHHAAGLEFSDLPLYVVDRPESLAGFGRAGIWSWVEEAGSSPGECIHHPTCIFFLRLESEGSFVEFPCP